MEKIWLIICNCKPKSRSGHGIMSCKGQFYTSLVYGGRHFKFCYPHCFTSEFDTPATFCQVNLINYIRLLININPIILIIKLARTCRMLAANVPAPKKKARWSSFLINLEAKIPKTINCTPLTNTKCINLSAGTNQRFATNKK